MLSICRRIAVAGSDIIHRVRPQAHRSVGEVFAGLGVIGWHGSQGRGPRFDHWRYVTNVTIITHQWGYQTGVTGDTPPRVEYFAENSNDNQVF